MDGRINKLFLLLTVAYFFADWTGWQFQNFGDILEIL